VPFFTKDQEIEKEKKARAEHAQRLKEQKQQVGDKIKADRAEMSQRPTRESVLRYKYMLILKCSS
jgi:hypothetical protein